MNNSLPTSCPSCSGRLLVTTLECTACGTSVGGRFALPDIAALSADDREFALKFLLASGSLKEVARQYGVSYPTVRNRLDDVIAKIKELRHEAEGV